MLKRRFLGKKVIFKLIVVMSLIIFHTNLFSQTILREEGGFKLLGLNNEVVLDPIYDSIFNLSKIKETEIRSKFFVFKKADKFGYAILTDSLNEKKWVVSDAKYDSVFWEEEVGASNRILEDRYKYRSLIKLKSNDLTGFIILNWNYGKDHIDGHIKGTGIKSVELLEPKYDDVLIDNIPVLILNGKVGLYFSDSKIIEPRYDSIKAVQMPGSRYYVWIKDKCGIATINQLSLPVQYNKSDLEIEDNRVIIRTIGQAFEIFRFSDSTYISILYNESKLINSDSIFISPSIIEIDGIEYLKVEVFPTNLKSRLGSDYWIPSKILLADPKSGEVRHAFDEHDHYYIWSCQYIISVEPKSSSKKKVRLEITNPITSNSIAKFKAWLNEPDSFVSMIDMGEYCQVSVMQQNGSMKTMGYLYYKDDEFTTTRK